MYIQLELKQLLIARLCPSILSISLSWSSWTYLIVKTKDTLFPVLYTPGTHPVSHFLVEYRVPFLLTLKRLNTFSCYFLLSCYLLYISIQSLLQTKIYTYKPIGIYRHTSSVFYVTTTHIILPQLYLHLYKLFHTLHLPWNRIPPSIFAIDCAKEQRIEYKKSACFCSFLSSYPFAHCTDFWKEGHLNYIIIIRDYLFTFIINSSLGLLIYISLSLHN